MLYYESIHVFLSALLFEGGGGATVDVCAEMHEGSFYAETPDYEE